MRHRQLKHGCLLALLKKRQQDDVAVWEFQRVMVCAQDLFVDLTENGSLVFDRALTPRPRTYTPHFLCEGKFSTGQETYGHVSIFRRTEACCTGVEPPRG